METIVVTVKGVKVFVDENSASVQLTLEKPIKGYAKNADGTYTEGDVDTISFHRSKLTAQLCDANDDIACYRSIIGQAFGQRQFGAILFKAQLTLEREAHSAGEVVGEGDDAYTCERDCYFTDVKKIKMSERAATLLNNAIADAFAL